ncbi:MAG: peptidoglycan DD-metalloendopeptidase family protein [Bacteroidota bacterium]
MRGSVKYILFFCLLVVTASFAQTTSKKELERKKERLQKEIDFTNNQLKIVSKNKNATKEQLEALQKKIKLREQLIGTINGEISALGGQIENTNKEIVSLEEKMKRLKAAYAEMVRYAYRNRNIYQRLMFIFAATDFNQAYKRISWLQQYSKHRMQQAAEITGTETELTGKKQDLETKKNQKTSLKISEQNNKATLEKEKVEQDQVMKNLTVREQKLKKDLAEKQAAKLKLDRAIESLIKKEIEAAKKKAVAAGKKNVTNANVFTSTPEAAKLSSGFSNNKGILPWPVDQGAITGTFGNHPHKELKGIMVNNNGIDIQSAKGSSARAIFDGTVSGVISIPGSNKAVIIRHGEYLTVYSNLTDVAVKTGDKVTTKQRIANIGNDDENQKAEVHLEIWKNTTKLNPQLWLKR